MTPCFFVIPHGIYTPFCGVENTLQLVVELLAPLVRSLVAAVAASLFVHALRNQRQSPHQQTELPSGFLGLLATALGSFDLTEFLVSYFVERCLSLLFPFAILHAFEFFPIPLLL